MTNQSEHPVGLLTEIVEHLSGIFRHMLPGVLVIAGARLGYPSWFTAVDLKSWQHLFVLGVISVAVGNTWLALNRYGLHQFVDYVLYICKSRGPARGNKRFTYLDDLGLYTYKSLHTKEDSKRARQHVAFRASTVLLALTVGELLVAFGFFHACNSVFAGYKVKVWMIAGGALVFVVGIWQMIITRRIDYYVVNPPS